MTGIRFSIVVPTRNRPESVRRLLQALVAQQYPRELFEVILVDDSGGESPLNDLEAEYRGRLSLNIIRQPNAGCGPARQSGVDSARGRYLAFTDDDCRPSPYWLARLAGAFDAHPDCAVGGPTVNGLTRNLMAETTQFIVNLLATLDCGPAGCIRYCPTSNLAFPAAAFRSIGGLDRSWANSGGEDRDLCARWIGAGFAVQFEPLAVVSHFHPLTVRRFVRQHFSYGRGAWLFHHASGRQGYQGYQRSHFYRKLLTAPFREYAPPKSVCVAAAVLAAQVATAAGFLFEAARGAVRRP